jgi:hypothetical protein
MSLLRACSQAIPRRALPTYTRRFSVETPTQPVQTREPSQKESTQIAEAVPTDVLTAEVISGAPCVFSLPDTNEKYLAELLLIQLNSVIARYASINQPVTPCRADQASPSGGALTGISFRERVGGRTP